MGELTEDLELCELRLFVSTCAVWRSMFPPTRHHNPGWWSREGRAGVHMVARALARLIDAESSRSEWREPGWQRRQPMSQSWRREPRRLNAPPPRSPPRRTPALGWWLPHTQGDPRRRRDWQPQRPEQRPQHWRGSMRPRRGPPVAAIRAPRWNQEEWGKRCPRGSDPRVPLRGGPERPADDPQSPTQNNLATVQRWRRRKRRSLGEAKDPPSSRWMRRGESDDGDLSREPR